MTIDSNSINKGLENIKIPYSDKDLKKETSNLKAIIHAHCLGILPTLQGASKVFSDNDEFVKLYDTIRGKSLKLSDLVDKERKAIVKFAYPIRLYERAKRTKEIKGVENFEIGARLGIDIISENGFAPALIFENGSKVDIKYFPDDDFIKNKLYNKLNPNIPEVDFLREVVENLSHWDTHKRFNADYRIISRFENTYLRLVYAVKTS